MTIEIIARRDVRDLRADPDDRALDRAERCTDERGRADLDVGEHLGILEQRFDPPAECRVVNPKHETFAGGQLLGLQGGVHVVDVVAADQSDGLCGTDPSGPERNPVRLRGVYDVDPIHPRDPRPMARRRIGEDRCHLRPVAR